MQVLLIAINNRYDAPSKPLIQELGWLTIEQLIKLKTVKVVYKALYNETPHYIKELFYKLSDTQSRELRNSSTDLYIPRLRTSVGQRALDIKGFIFGIT